MNIKRYILIILIAAIMIAAKWGGDPFVSESVSATVNQRLLWEIGPPEPSARQLLNTAIFHHLLSYLQGCRIFIPRSELQVIVSAVQESSDRYGLQPELIFSLIQKESSFKSQAVSAKGAIGLMQVLPSTAEILAQELKIDLSGNTTLFDPTVNVEIGTYYLSKLLNDYKDLDTALSAYNIGPTRITEIKGDAPSLQTDFSQRVREDQSKHSLPRPQ